MAEIKSLAVREPIARHLQRLRTDRLIMLSDGIFAIATTLAAMLVPIALMTFAIRRFIAPRYWSAKAVDSEA